jgi:membrane fusion protein (multidrug efflux system)
MIGTGKRGLFLAAVIVSGMLSLAGCGSKEPQQASAPEVSVVYVKPERVAITIELAGRTSAQLVAEVRPQVGGIIQKRLFTEGSDVKAGQVLYQIDPSTYRAAYGSAKAALARAEANLITVRLKAERYRGLIGIKAISWQEYDDAEAALKQAEAEVAGGRAALETARINLGYTRVTAPISGRIGKSAVTNGALVTANQGNALSVIQKLDPMYVDVIQSNVDQLKQKDDIAKGKLNSGSAKVRLILDNGKYYAETGTLKFSDVTVDKTTGSVTVRTVFPNKGRMLLPGMFVKAVVEEGVKNDAILIPQQAVARDPKGNATILLVNGEEKIEQRIIRVGQTMGDKWLVLDGVKAGERIVMEGGIRVKPGMTVKAVLFQDRQAALGSGVSAAVQGNGGR